MSAYPCCHPITHISTQKHRDATSFFGGGRVGGEGALESNGSAQGQKSSAVSATGNPPHWVKSLGSPYPRSWADAVGEIAA